MKSKNVCNKTRSAPASLQFKGKGTEHTTVKLPIKATCCILKCFVCEFISLRDCDRVWLFRWEYFNPLSVNQYTPKTVKTIKIYTYNYYEKENKNIEIKSLYKYMTYKIKVWNKNILINLLYLSLSTNEQRFYQPRPHGFSLKKWVGREKAPIFWGKSPGDEVEILPIRARRWICSEMSWNTVIDEK